MKKKIFCLDDYKLTSTYAVKDGVKPEWEAQLNIYALMLREYGYTVEALRIVAILRDWQRAKAKHDPERYPQVPALILPVNMWSAEKTETYIKDRLLAHGWAQHELPECTAEERWERPGVYVIVKKGNSRATSVHATLAAAEEALAALPGALYAITERPAEQRRCQDYCPALPFCEQGQGLLKQIEDFRLAKLWTVASPRAAANEERGKVTDNATKP